MLPASLSETPEKMLPRKIILDILPSSRLLAVIIIFFSLSRLFWPKISRNSWGMPGIRWRQGIRHPQRCTSTTLLFMRIYAGVLNLIKDEDLRKNTKERWGKLSNFGLKYFPKLLLQEAGSLIGRLKKNICISGTYRSQYDKCVDLRCLLCWRSCDLFFVACQIGTVTFQAKNGPHTYVRISLWPQKVCERGRDL